VGSSQEIPVVIEEAPFHFVLLGPVHGRQGLLAHSHPLDLLLLGSVRLSQQRVLEPYDPGLKDVPAIRGVYANDPAAMLFSLTISAQVDSKSETRQEPFTLAWLGNRPHADLTEVRGYFHNCAVPTYRAIVGESGEDVRFQLSPLLVRCVQATTRARLVHRMWALLKPGVEALVGLCVLLALLGLLLTLIGWIVPYLRKS
jgi:hypothetical protein